jgi:hypothetical protein
VTQGPSVCYQLHLNQQTQVLRWTPEKQVACWKGQGHGEYSIASGHSLANKFRDNMAFCPPSAPHPSQPAHSYEVPSCALHTQVTTNQEMDLQPESG